MNIMETTEKMKQVFFTYLEVPLTTLRTAIGWSS
jgi:hypothetical protein